MNKLILIYTPYHQLFISQLIESRKVYCENIVVIDFCKRRAKLGSHYYHIGGKALAMLLLSLIAKFSGYFLLKIFKIDALIIPHSDGIVANILTHKILKSWDKRVSIELYHEGVLSFYNYKENPIVFPSRKFLLSLLSFHVFKYKKGFFPIENARTFYIPRNLGKYVAYNVNIEEITLSSFIFGNITVGQGLFLGQPDYYDKERFQYLLCKELTHLKIKRLYYKPHPVETSMLDLSSCPCEIVHLDSRIPIERLASELDPELVLSGLSSAMVSLISANPDVSFSSIVPSSTLVHARKSIAKVFKEMGVILVSH